MTSSFASECIVRASTTKTEADFNREWKNLQTSKPRIADQAFWDKRAATYSSTDTPAQYVQSFLEKARILPGESVFDMGCGTGALSVPLGEAKHEVIACDFSHNMLSVMEQTLRKRRICSVHPRLLSWHDNWNEQGVERECVDVALASRSLSVYDLAAALRQLDRVARRRVCITVSSELSPRCDKRALQAADLEKASLESSDCFYALNILHCRGIHAEASCLVSERRDTFGSFEEACAKYDNMLSGFAFRLGPDQMERALFKVHRWLDGQLVENEQAGALDDRGRPQKAFRLREPRVTTWAFIAWDKSTSR